MPDDLTGKVALVGPDFRHGSLFVSDVSHNNREPSQGQAQQHDDDQQRL